MFTEFSDRLRVKYGQQYERYGPTPKGSFWASKYRQELRFQIILNEINKVSANVVKNLADVGCGYGALATYIQSNNTFNNYRYEGYDICQDIIKFCRTDYSTKMHNFFGRIPFIKSIIYCDVWNI